jgi:hypothetical protein
MSLNPAGARLIEPSRAVLPRSQRILAPSTVDVIDSDMGGPHCIGALKVIDVVNLDVYYVPMTIEMVEHTRDRLEELGAKYHNAQDNRSNHS